MLSHVFKVLTLALMLVCSLPVGAQNFDATTDSIVDPSSQTLPIGHLTQINLREPASYLVTDDSVPLSQVLTAKFRPLSSSELNQGISNRRYWLRFTLHNDAVAERRWLIHNEVSYIDFLNIYVRDVVSPELLGRGSSNDFIGSTISDRQPFDTRPVDYRRLTYAHTTAPGEYTEVFIELGYEKADALNLDFTLIEQSQFLSRVQQENVLLGAYYGILALLLLIALVIALVLRQRSAVYYAAFLCASAMMWMLLNGVGFQYLWPDNVYWQNSGFHISFLLFSLAAFQFSTEFLQTAQRVPRLHKVMRLCQAFMLMGILLRLLGVYEPVLYFAYAGLGMTVVLAFVGWHAWRDGLQHARWYTAGWAIYSVALLVALLSAGSAIIQAGMAPLAYVQVASLLEAMLLMLAMGERVLHLERSRQIAMDMAYRDPLTGLGNRRMLTRRYEDLQMQFRVDQMPVFVILIDLDHFKQINDQYGHSAGDQVLRKLAGLMCMYSRQSDACMRFGGDEFVIMLRAESLEAVQGIADRLRQHFADRPTTYEGQLIRHTLSAGIIPAIAQGVSLSAAEVLARVDKALYDAKSAGRNSTVILQQI